MIHSDRGMQYASLDFRAILEKHGCVQRMSRKENCWNNAVAESFFGKIKTQRIHHNTFFCVIQAERAMFKYIETLQPEKKAFFQCV